MTDNELDQLMQRVLLDAIKSDCEKENSVVPSFEPSLRYQRSLAAMIADPLKWARKRTKPLWKKALQKVAIVLIIFSLSLGRTALPSSWTNRYKYIRRIQKHHRSATADLCPVRPYRS